MITIHASLVCRVRDGYTGRPLEGSALLCSLDGTAVLLSRLNAGEGSVGQFLANDTLYRNLENSSRQLNLLLEDVRLNPERYVHISVFGRKEKKSGK